MLINKSSLSAIYANLLATFNKTFQATPAMWSKIAMKITSTTKQNDYAWLSNFPKMRQWVGEKHIKSLEGFKYTIDNRPYEATIRVLRDDIEDDNLGIYGPQAQGAGYSAAMWPDEIVMELVNGAFTTLCYDGQYFCDTDHQVAGASVSNKGTAALSFATLALAQASYGAACTAMETFKDDEGRPLNTRGNILLVGPALRDMARLGMTVDKLEDGKPNPYKGTAEVVVDARITSPTAWFLLDTTKPIKPFIFQERKAPVFVSQTDMNADAVFLRGEFLFGAEARGAGGYGFWQLCYGSTGAG